MLRTAPFEPQTLSHLSTLHRAVADDSPQLSVKAAKADQLSTFSPATPSLLRVAYRAHPRSRHSGRDRAQGFDETCRYTHDRNPSQMSAVSGHVLARSGASIVFRLQR